MQTAPSRVVRLARRQFAVGTAAFVPAFGAPVADGTLPAALVELLGRSIGAAGRGVVVEDASAVASLAPVAGQVGFVAGVPVGPGGALLVADAAARPFPPADREALADLAALLAEVQAAQPVREALAHAPLLVYVLDAEGTFVFSEGSPLRSLRLEDGEVVGRSIFDCSSDQSVTAAHAREALAGRPQSFLCEVEDLTFECQMLPHVDESGAVRSVTGLSLDVSRRVRMEQSVVEARQEAEAARERAEGAARQQQAFLVAMSHEIRTPLTGILGFADLLADTVEDEAASYAERIQKGGRRLLETLNSVLDLARLGADQVEVRRSALDLAAEAHEQAALLEPLATQKGLALHVDAEPVLAETDPSLVGRILANLIGNAIKFTDEGHVRVTLAVEEGAARIRVADTGPGIEAEFLPHLFEPYRRAETPGAGGTGLGLSIAQRLAALLGGRITVETTPGAGTTFTLELPLGATASGDGAPAEPPVASDAHA